MYKVTLYWKAGGTIGSFKAKTKKQISRIIHTYDNGISASIDNDKGKEIGFKKSGAKRIIYI